MALGVARGALAFAGTFAAGAGAGAGIAWATGGDVGEGALMGGELLSGVGAMSPRLSAAAVDWTIGAAGNAARRGAAFASVPRTALAAEGHAAGRVACLRAKWGRLSAVERRALIAEKVELNAQRWLTNLQGGIPKGHFLTKHSPMTTWFDQAVRANTGIINGEFGRAVNASRFYRYSDMMHAVDRAMRIGQTSTIRFEHVIGGGFYKGSLRFAESSEALVRLNKFGLPYTAYPMLP